MPPTDEELTLYATREAQLILADYIHPGPRDADKTINALALGAGPRPAHAGPGVQSKHPPQRAFADDAAT